MNIIKAYATENLCYISGVKMVPQGIVVHSTGANNPTLKRYVDCPEEVGYNKYCNHWNQPMPGGRMVCVHAFIGYDKNNTVRVAEILPLDICCWGVGSGVKGSYNNSPPYIQFEICEDDLKNPTYYREAFSVAASYCAQLCRRYGFTVDKIVGHCEAYRQGYGCNHADPEHWMRKFGETMTDFRHTVSKLLNSGGVMHSDSPIKAERKTDLPYCVQVTAVPLIIRKGAGIYTTQVGCIEEKGIYTIVEERQGDGAALWGRLKSGIGWIPLDYVRVFSR